MDGMKFEHDGRMIETPLVVAFGPNGKPAELIGDMEAENCDHAGAAWSSSMALYCRRCGARMFLPARILAGLPDYEIEVMYREWQRAGWPEWAPEGWHVCPDAWTVIAHPLFAGVGGLAVRNDRLDNFPAVRHGGS
jgi:hypothetical protein